MSRHPSQDILLIGMIYRVDDARQSNALLSRDKRCDINAQDDIQKSSNH